ncbi:DUF4304 domain-containing protein [Streptomyces sp. CHA1]|uniref:DUF4304 domain-containing protein n=1 Tax=Streptomyces TaxID=1883 RepID=UPI001BFC8046|nr:MULTISPECIES: DUF4304 domain-containing protein [unclassified Streptomyces]WSB20712.1 DUF4304 domain-containing protein [Streptomyces albidoflavus]MBT3156261.1 DUF4304 domain-containing protein [Streptomyces sp. G11C]MCO6702432.1 DUF4304 domain-containing protein [Streptomyces sp. CHB9.2]MCO6708783.1 DUF4304 domain-containing protein [Streptomyces sp. CHA3]MCO6714575.1 DUF4304 domain-containing protein [Streptomyces sp. CHB19.2]
MVNSILLEALNEVFKPLGFRKKSANWCRVSGDLYCVVGVQESRWDKSCYVNVGFAPAVNVNAGWLPESKCLVRFRADAITAISREDLDLLSGEAAEASGEDDLRVGLVEKIATPVARAVNPIESIEGLKSLLRASVSDQVFIHREIRGKLLEEE